MAHGSRFRASMKLAITLFLAGPMVGSALVAQTQEPAKSEAGTNQAVPTNTVIRTESREVLVDVVVTDKKGHYITGLTQADFKVYEDKKEQIITSFSFGSDPQVQAAGQKHYVLLFFDNSTMDIGDQMASRDAAAKFIESDSSANQWTAVVNFGGSLVVQQNFTADVALLKAAVSMTSTPMIETNGQSSSPVTVASLGMPEIKRAAEDYGVRSTLLAIRSLAKSLGPLPGRKMLILFTSGFPLNSESLPEVMAAIAVCNKANVAVYPVDARGLTTGMAPAGKRKLVPGASERNANLVAVRDGPREARPHLVLSSYSAASLLAAQKPGGGGSGTGAGGGTGGGGGKGGSGGAPGGGAGGGVTTAPSPHPSSNPEMVLPWYPPQLKALPGVTNQQVMRLLAAGTGGFAIYDTNGLLRGLQRIAQELDQFYVLGYVPQETAEGSCHALTVKLNKSGLELRSRTGYCNVRPKDPLATKPLGIKMEAQARAPTPGTIPGTMQTAYFYSAPDLARVNLAMEIPGDSVIFNKDKGRYHANVNVLGIAYNSDGSEVARFSDTLDLELTSDQWNEFVKHPYHYQNQFDIGAGNYKLAVVLSSGGQGFAKMETPLVIDAYDGNKIALSGVVLSTSYQRVDEIQGEVDTALVEDRKPLIARNILFTPAANYQFRRTDTVALYSELYVPELKIGPITAIVSGYRIVDKATNRQVFSTGGVPLSDFVKKGNPVVPYELRVEVYDLQPGNYRLHLFAVDPDGHRAPERSVDFTVIN